MTDARRRRPLALCLLVSLLLHAVGLWLGDRLLTPSLQQARFRVRLSVVAPAAPERFRPRPAAAVDRQFLGQLRSERARPVDAEIGLEGPALEVLPGLRAPAAVSDSGAWLGARGEWAAPADTMPDASLGLLEQTGELPLAMDLVELDAEARRRTVVIIDPVTGRLRRAWLHLPVYTKTRETCEGCSPRAVDRGWGEALERIPAGYDLPLAVQLISRVHMYRLNLPADPVPGIPSLRPDDPIHRFRRYPARFIMPPSVMAEYPLLDLRQMDVESTAAMADYLVAGGFGIVDRGQLDRLERGLTVRCGDRLERVPVRVEHPLFRAHFEVDHYVTQRHCCRFDDNVMFPHCYRWCPGFGPLTGLELDGRLVAVCDVPQYVTDCACLSNQVYVNVLAFALTQPSAMGGRFLARE